MRRLCSVFFVPVLEFHLRGQGNSHFEKRALPLKNLQVYENILKGHQGQDQGEHVVCMWLQVFWKVNFHWKSFQFVRIFWRGTKAKARATCGLHVTPGLLKSFQFVRIFCRGTKAKTRATCGLYVTPGLVYFSCLSTLLLWASLNLSIESTHC